MQVTGLLALCAPFALLLLGYLWQAVRRNPWTPEEKLPAVFCLTAMSGGAFCWLLVKAAVVHWSAAALAMLTLAAACVLFILGK